MAIKQANTPRTVILLRPRVQVAWLNRVVAVGLKVVRVAPRVEVERVTAWPEPAQTPLLVDRATLRPEEAVARSGIGPAVLAEAIPTREVILPKGEAAAVLAPAVTPRLPVPPYTLTAWRGAAPASMRGRGGDQMVPAFPTPVAAQQVP